MESVLFGKSDELSHGLSSWSQTLELFSLSFVLDGLFLWFRKEKEN